MIDRIKREINVLGVIDTAKLETKNVFRKIKSITNKPLAMVGIEKTHIHREFKNIENKFKKIKF